MARLVLFEIVLVGAILALIALILFLFFNNTRPVQWLIRGLRGKRKEEEGTNNDSGQNS
jgi:uncharacterized membrane protein YqiK